MAAFVVFLFPCLFFLSVPALPCPLVIYHCLVLFLLFFLLSHIYLFSICVSASSFCRYYLLSRGFNHLDSIIKLFWKKGSQAIEKHPFSGKSLFFLSYHCPCLCWSSALLSSYSLFFLLKKKQIYNHSQETLILTYLLKHTHTPKLPTQRILKLIEMDTGFYPGKNRYTSVL